MPKIVRKTDVCSGHSCFPPRASASASGDVFANGIAVERNGDALQSHSCPPPAHGGSWVGGSSVYVNGKAIQKEGSPIDCGSVGAQTSPDVTADGA